MQDQSLILLSGKAYVCVLTFFLNKNKYAFNFGHFSVSVILLLCMVCQACLHHSPAFPLFLLTPCYMLDAVVFPLLVLKSVPGKSDTQHERTQKWPSLAMFANSGFELVQSV